jgi:hypothetical protein
MRIHRLLPLAVLALGGLSLGSGCPTIPKIQDRVVELAVGGTTTLDFVADGSTNTWSGTGDYDLADIDINSLISGAGIDIQDVKSVTLSAVSYRVSVPDPTTGRTITSGSVSATRGGGSPVTLLSNFQQAADQETPFITAPVSAAGVTMINDLLSDLLTAAKNGGTVPNSSVHYSYNGDSQPVGIPTHFTWQLKLDLSIVGNVKVKVLDGD